MSRDLFFLITAILSVLFGLAALFMPNGIIKGYGFEPTPEKIWMFRIFGGMILSAGVLNFLVRHQADFDTVKAVLIFNIIFYVIRMTNDGVGLGQKLFTIDKIFIGELIHLFICIGSIVYLIKGNN